LGEHVVPRAFVVEDGKQAYELEDAIKRGAVGQRLLLNPQQALPCSRPPAGRGSPLSATRFFPAARFVA
jgi:hypothetical protein